MAPSIVYMPRIGALWEVTTETFKATFLSLLLSLSSSTPVLVVGTSEAPWSALPLSLQEVFRGVRWRNESVRACVHACVHVESWNV